MALLLLLLALGSNAQLLSNVLPKAPRNAYYNPLPASPVFAEYESAKANSFKSGAEAERLLAEMARPWEGMQDPRKDRPVSKTGIVAHPPAPMHSLIEELSSSRPQQVVAFGSGALNKDSPLAASPHFRDSFYATLEKAGAMVNDNQKRYHPGMPQNMPHNYKAAIVRAYEKSFPSVLLSLEARPVVHARPREYFQVGHTPSYSRMSFPVVYHDASSLLSVSSVASSSANKKNPPIEHFQFPQQVMVPYMVPMPYYSAPPGMVPLAQASALAPVSGCIATVQCQVSSPQFQYVASPSLYMPYH